jgi:glutamate-5-semialdehyde dehydrogenase
MNTTVNIVSKICDDAKKTCLELADSTTDQKNKFLIDLAHLIKKNKEVLFSANKKDIAQAIANGQEDAFLDRLKIDEKAIQSMTDGLMQIALLSDPVGELINTKRQPSGITVGTMRVPIGVIGIIYESRPNVTADAAGLCLKSGNTLILRGGSESLNSNLAITDLCILALKKNALPEKAIQIIPIVDREAVNVLITQKDKVDVIIPRGGKSLIQIISENATVPVIKHLDGVCHVYVDSDANMEKALKITDNSKTQRLGTCNTLETLLVSQEIASLFMPKICTLLLKKKIEIRICPLTKEILVACNYDVEKLINANEKDWSTEYLSNIISVKTVCGIDEAISHIARYGSNHTDCIVTENHSKAMKFLNKVDSSSVMINASTRFADGFQYGLGGEIGISTNKLHARGPVGLEGLTTKKWIVFGDGHIRQ